MLPIPTGDKWFSQLLVVTPRSKFTGRRIHLWVSHIQAILRPRKLLDHQTNNAPSETDPQHKKEIPFAEILDSMLTELANRFIEYQIEKEIWDAAHKYYSKKNDRSQIPQLSNPAAALRQGERSLLTYRVYELLQGLRPEFEGISSQLHNRENSLTCDDVASQLLSEESHLQEMNGGGDSSAYAVTNLGGSRSNENAPPRSSNTNKTSVKNKDNLRCNYCK